MKKLFLSLFLLAVALPMFAGIVSQEEAQRKAEEFWQSKVGMPLTRSSAGLKMVMAEPKKSVTRSAEVAFYIFTADAEGFVIVSGDDRTPAILGYSLENTFDVNNIPTNMRAWLDGYVEQISDPTAKSLAVRKADTKKTINPLVKAKWNQDAPYNGQCPMIETEQTVTGCVATALAQCMSVWKYPSVLPACKGYDDVPDISAHTIDWTKIKDSYSSNDTDDNIAWLMRHCGQEIDMSYGLASTGGSGAGTYKVEKALKAFGYNDTHTYMIRDYYKNDSWEDLIYNELANNRPVLYSGRTINDEGHAFVCDGYDASNGSFHINWGWGGYSDGQFLLSVLEPGSQGIGGGSGGFAQSQSAVIGISHDGNTTTERHLYCIGYDLNNTTLSCFYWNYSVLGNKYKIGYGYIDNNGNINFIAAINDDISFKSLEYQPYSLDLSAYLKTDGTYKVVPISKYGEGDWKNCFKEGVYVTYKVNNGTVTASLEEPYVDYEATITSIEGTKMAGFNHTVIVSVQNNGTEEQLTPYYYVYGPTGNKIVDQHPTIYVNSGATEEYSFTFTAETEGKYTAIVASKEIGSINDKNILSKKEIEITTAATYQNISITNAHLTYGNPLKVSVTVKNGDAQDFVYPVGVDVYRLDIGSSGTSYPYFTYAEVTEVVKSGDSKTVDIPITAFADDGRYYFRIYYAYKPGYIYYVDNDILENIFAANINEEGIITYARQYALDFSDIDGLTAYSGKISEDGTKVELTEQKKQIKANTGLVLKGTPNANYAIPYSFSGTAISDNQLVGVTEDVAVAENSVYVLGKGKSGVVGFYNFKGTTITAGHAYLPKPAGSSSLAASPYLELSVNNGAVTKIEPTIEETTVDGAIYNIHGQKVDENYKGIVIKNGKKYLMK